MRDYGITDPEFTAICERFLAETGEEAARELPPRTGALAVPLNCIGCTRTAVVRRVRPGALSGDPPPEEARETVYQAADYLGLGRMLPFLDALDGVLEERGVSLPLPAMGTTDESDRLGRGAAAQAEIFGEHMLEAWKAGFINRALAANCFGDYYTRGALDLRDRELITFCFLAAQGGCEPQLTAHARGNMNMGSSRETLLAVCVKCLPYIGYPRTLNAVACVNKAAEG